MTDEEEQREWNGWFDFAIAGALIAVVGILLFGCPHVKGAPPKAPPVGVPPKAPPVEAEPSAILPKVEPRVTEYARVYARVLAGERVVVTVGSYGMDGAPFKIPQGVWVFYLDGVPTMRQEVSPTAKHFRPGATTADTVVHTPGAAGASTSSPDAAPFRVRTLTPARPGTLGGIENCGPLG